MVITNLNKATKEPTKSDNKNHKTLTTIKSINCQVNLNKIQEIKRTICQ